MTAVFDLTAYLNQGTEQLVQDILKATLRNPKEAAFLRRYHAAQRGTEKRRTALEAEGQHIPMFLIASITNACNLFCKGCYARANGQCGQTSTEPLLDAKQWDGIFSQAEEAGIPFILLAGGEPMMRPDVLRAAAEHKSILFPIFTNGTLIDKSLLALLDQHRNLVPVVSLEGGESATDRRRGDGAYRHAQAALHNLSDNKLLFGVSLTVTTENRPEVMSADFMQSLYQEGCRLVFFIEYVPVAPNTEYLAPDDAERLVIEEAQDSLRARFTGMVFLSFPGDEKHMGGCLAAGRGFFHINAHGAAEPCPFSPYSDMNLRDHTLLEVLHSPFFRLVRDLNAQGRAHMGGCALFENEAQVKALLFPQKA
ncbi:MAG: radical SAM protein [Eubacteriales bacterium]|nr:radical SAM protein [Eubacteriales bacterium]